MDHRQAYQYHPLPEGHFRLVRLFPGTVNDTIKIKLELYELSKAPPFTALSYCWLDQAFDHDCDCEPSQFVSITENVSQALRQCRSAADDVHIWIDQICIDQKSNADKAQQVRLMRGIYLGAKNVIIWLGAADAETRLVYKLIDDIGQDIARKQGWLAGKDPIARNSAVNAHAPFEYSSSDQPEWRAFRNFLRGQWFERTWTFQELVLAKQAYLWRGEHKTSWMQFVLVCRTIDANDRAEGQRDAESHLQGLTERVDFLSTCAARRVFRRKRPDFDRETQAWAELGTLLKNTMQLKASIGHDKIYGLLGVAEDVDVDRFRVDYEAPLREVFAHVTKYLIVQHGDLAPLSLKSVIPEMIPRTGPASLPSWIPDYRYDRSEFENPRLFSGPKPLAGGCDRLFSSTGLSKANIDIDSGLELRLQGVFVSSIRVLSDTSGNKIGSQNIGDNVLTGGVWHQLARQYSTRGIYAITGENVDRAYARTRICDYLPGETRPQHRTTKPRANILVPEPMTSSLITTPNGERLLHSVAGDVMPGRIMASTTGQRLCISRDGHMCLCHQNCIEGDEIWLIMGADMPYVLRKLESGKYHFMGEAYVHGIMDGEHLVQHYKHTTCDGLSLTDREWLNALADKVDFPTQEILLI